MEPNAGLASTHEAAFGVFLWAVSVLHVVWWAVGGASGEAMGAEVSLAFTIAFGLSCLLARDGWRRWHRRTQIVAPTRSGHPYR